MRKMMVLCDMCEKPVPDGTVRARFPSKFKFGEPSRIKDRHDKVIGDFKHVDLCPTCLDAVADFMRSKKDESR